MPVPRLVLLAFLVQASLLQVQQISIQNLKFYPTMGKQDLYRKTFSLLIYFGIHYLPFRLNNIKQAIFTDLLVKYAVYDF